MLEDHAAIGGGKQAQPLRRGVTKPRRHRPGEAAAAIAEAVLGQVGTQEVGGKLAATSPFTSTRIAGARPA
ncbi:hypothetical protein GCM10011504_34500 [Siccirubricoccus deserti]|nr:hypothetical protein GCM10011504_34500 [Siccirubricoccus deserti]